LSLLAFLWRKPRSSAPFRTRILSPETAFKCRFPVFRRLSLCRQFPTHGFPSARRVHPREVSIFERQLSENERPWRLDYVAPDGTWADFTRAHARRHCKRRARVRTRQGPRCKSQCAIRLQ
jgi:hypothetical protein